MGDLKSINAIIEDVVVDASGAVRGFIEVHSISHKMRAKVGL